MTARTTTRTSWITQQSHNAIRREVYGGETEINNNNYYYSSSSSSNKKELLTRRLNFVKPIRACNETPEHSNEQIANVYGVTPSRQPSEFMPPKYHLYREEKMQEILHWKISRISIGSGLQNLGNSCFMNAVLQCLAYTPALYQYILAKDHPSKCRLTGFCAFCTVHKLLPQMLNSSHAVIPHLLFRNLRMLSKQLRPGRQEDAHEFLRYMLEAFQTSVLKHEKSQIKDVRIQETSIVHKIWGGYLRSQVKCCHCGKESNTYDSILDLSLEIKGNSVMTALKHFTAKEWLTGNNKYRCGQCRSLQKAMKQLSIFEPPNILVLHLKRFEYQSHGFGFGGGKINKHIEFAPELDITSIMSYTTCPKVSYSLFAVIVHYGHAAHSGHYIAYVKSPNGKWYCMDDASVSPVSLQTVLSKNAYLLFYIRNEPKIPYQSPLISSCNGSHTIAKDIKETSSLLLDANTNGKLDQSSKNKKIEQKPKINQRKENGNSIKKNITNIPNMKHTPEVSRSLSSSANISNKNRKRTMMECDMNGDEENINSIPSFSKKRRVTTTIRNNNPDELLKMFLEESDNITNTTVWGQYISTSPPPIQRQDSILSVLSDSPTANNNGDGTESCTTIESQTETQTPTPTQTPTQNYREKNKNHDIEIECCNAPKSEIQAFLNQEDMTIGSKNINGWGIDIALDNRIQEYQQQLKQKLKEDMQEFIPPKDEWDQQLDSGLVYGKKKSKKNQAQRWKEMEEKMGLSNAFQSRQNGKINQDTPMRNIINSQTGEKTKLEFKRYTKKNTSKRYRNYRLDKRHDL